MGLGLFSNKNGKTLEQIKQDVEDIKKKNNTGKVKTAGKTNDVEELVLGMVAAGMCDITGTINSGSAQQLLNGKKSFLRFIKEDVRKSTHMFQNFTHGFKKVFIQDSFKVHLTGIDPGAFDLTPLNVAMTITGEGANVDTLINLLKELKGEDVQNISLGLETIRDILGYISEIKFDGSNLKSLDQLPEILKTLSKSLTEVNIDFSKIDQIEELKKVVGYLNDINLVLSNLSTNPEVANNVKLLNEGIEGVSKTIDIIASIDVKGIKTKSKVLTDGVDAVAEFSKKIDEAFPKNASLDKSIKKILVTRDFEKNIEATRALIEKLPDLLKDLKEVGESITEEDIENIKKVTESLGDIIKQINRINPKAIEQCVNLVDSISRMMVILTGMLILGSIVMSFIDMGNVFKYLFGMLALIGGAILIIYALDEFGKEFEGKDKFLRSLTEFIFFSTLSLIAGSFAAKYVSYGDIFKFLIGLTILITGVMVITGLLDKAFSFEHIGKLGQLAILVLACGISLALGSWLGQNVDPANIIAFGLALGLLIFCILTPLTFFSGVKIFMENSLRDLSILVITCALTLLLGSALFHFIPLADILGFTVLLGVFIMGLLGAMVLASKLNTKENKLNMAGVGQVVLMSTISMLLGSFVYRYIPFGDLIGFTAMLLVFVGGLILATGLAAKLANGNAMENMKQLSILVAISSLCMLLGGYLLMKGGMKFFGYVIGFTVLLALFISGIVIAVGWAMKLGGKDAMKHMYGLALVILISSLAMILGPKYLKEHGIGWEEVLLFAGGLIVFVGLFAIVLNLIGRGASKIGLGILCVAGIAVVTFGLTWVLGYMNQVAQEINFDVLDDFLWRAGIVIGSIAVVCGVMGIGPIAAAIAIGEALFAGLLAIVYGICKVMILMNNAAKHITAIKNLKEEDFNGVGVFLECMIGTFASLMLPKNWIKIVGAIAAIPVILSLSAAISALAFGIQNFANLKMPIYNDKGEIIGFRPMKETDFEDAANNIKRVISTVGGAVMDLINSGDQELMKELLEPAGFLGGTTKFGKLIDSTGKLGGLISNIAKGVKDYAELRVEEYDKEGKPTGKFRKFTEDDFKLCASHIGEIITAVGGAIMGLIKNGDKELMKELLQGSGWFGTGESKFGKLIDATSKLGEMISNMAMGVKALADLRIEEYDADGKPTGKFRTFTDDDFKEARKNAKRIITEIATSAFDAINELMNNDAYEDFFDDTDDVITFTTNINTILDTLSKSVTSIAEIMKKADEANINTNNIINKIYFPFRTIVKSIMWQTPDKNDIFYHIYKNPNDTRDYLNTLSNIGSTLKKFMDNINSIQTSDLNEKSNIISGSISNLVNVIEEKLSWDANDKFEQHKNSLKEYIETINSIDVAKVDKMVDLIDSITELKMQFDDMGKFADVFANKIAGILYELTLRIDDANKTIKKTDDLNEKRKKLIRDSVGKIKDLMSKEMVVKIKPPEKEENGGTPPPTKPSGSGGNGGGNAGTGDSGNTTGGIPTLFNSAGNSVGNNGGNNSGGFNLTQAELETAIKNAILAANDQK